MVYIYNIGDKVYDTMAEKSAIVVNLRNDFHERLMREKDPTYYYYHLTYDDETFDTYVSGEYLIKNHNYYKQTQTQSNHQSNHQFESGQRFINTRTNQTGTIKYLRNDERERNIRLLNNNHYYYHVDYDDGSFETYEYGLYLKNI